MSPQAHACVDEKHFEVVGSTFSNTARNLAKCFIHKRSLVLRGAACCNSFEGFNKGGKQKFHDELYADLSQPGTTEHVSQLT